MLLAFLDRGHDRRKLCRRDVIARHELGQVIDLEHLLQFSRCGCQIKASAHGWIVPFRVLVLVESRLLRMGSDAKRQRWLGRMRATAGASLGVRPIPGEASATSTCRSRIHTRGNGRGNLEMAAVLDFIYFQGIGWK